MKTTVYVVRVDLPGPTRYFVRQAEDDWHLMAQLRPFYPNGISACRIGWINEPSNERVRRESLEQLEKLRNG